MRGRQHIPEDDGLRNRAGRGGKGGTNHRFPCGHPRTPENLSDGHRCRICRNRLRRESYWRNR